MQSKAEIKLIKCDIKRIAARKELRRVIDRQTFYQHTGRKFYEKRSKNES
jgi:hypothetical protein